MTDASGAQTLRRFVEQLNCPYGVERSLKFCMGRLYDQRLLLSVHKNALGENSRERLIALASELDMPAELEAKMLLELSKADIIHLGYEGSGKNDSERIVKVYLEFSDRFLKRAEEANASSGRQRPELLHRAFKWDLLDPKRCAITNYHCQPGLSRSDMEAEIHKAFSLSTKVENEIESHCEKRIEGRQLSLELLDQVCRRVSAEEILLMQVTEEDNLRYSFDLNLYDVELRLADVQSFVAASAQLLSVPDEWQSLFDVNSNEVLGHIAAGTGRDGQPFFSFYYGVESHGE